MSENQNGNRDTKKRATIPSATEIEVVPAEHEPSDDELEEEVSMPNLTLEEAKERFMRPFKTVQAERKKRTEVPD